MRLDTVPARIGEHDSGNTSDDSVIVRWHVDAHQSVIVDDCIVLVDSLVRSTSSNIVPCACSDFLSAQFARVAAPNINIVLNIWNFFF